jgi:two-component system response regulator MprA
MASASEAAASSTTDAGLEPETILIVDDDHAILNGLSELLESEGYAVATAIDGADALNQLRAGLRPCVIVLDLMMPRMDGWDFRHAQLNDPLLKDLPVIIITAAGFSEKSIKTQFGDIELVHKPPPERELLDAIKRRCGEPIH